MGGGPELPADTKNNDDSGAKKHGGGGFSPQSTGNYAPPESPTPMHDATQDQHPKGRGKTMRYVPSGLTPEKRERFEKRRKRGETFNRWALRLFIVTQVVYLAVGGFAIFAMVAGWEQVTDTNNNGHPGRRSEETPPASAQEIKQKYFTPQARAMYIFATFISLALNVVLLLTMKWMARIYVWMGPACYMLCALATIAVTALQKQWLICTFWGLATAFFIFVLYTIRDRFKLGKHLLRLAGNFAAKSPSVYALVLLGLFVQFALAALNIYAVVGCFMVFQPNHEGCGRQRLPCSWALSIGGCVFLLIAHLWLSAMVSGAILMALAGGSFSTRYFGGDRREGNAFRALRHTLQDALGTLAFGTLFMGLVELLAGFVRKLVPSTSEPSCIGVLLLFIFGWLVSLFETLLDWFNKYAYIFCAIGKREWVKEDGKVEEELKVTIPPYQQTYWEAAFHCADFIVRRPRDKGAAQQVAQNHAISTIVNDNITGTAALLMACLANAGLCSLLTWLYSWLTTNTFSFKEGADALTLIYAFILGLTIGLLTTSALEIGVSTIFVCMSEDISRLEHVDPDFNEFVKHNYKEMFEHLGGEITEKNRKMSTEKRSDSYA